MNDDLMYWVMLDGGVLFNLGLYPKGLAAYVYKDERKLDVEYSYSLKVRVLDQEHAIFFGFGYKTQEDAQRQAMERAKEVLMAAKLYSTPLEQGICRLVHSITKLHEEKTT